MELSMYKSSYGETTRKRVGIKWKKTRLKLRLLTYDDGRTRKALVDTKAYDRVCKDRDEEKYSSNDVLEKDN